MILTFSLFSCQLHLLLRNFILCTSTDTIVGPSYSSAHFFLYPSKMPNILQCHSLFSYASFSFLNISFSYEHSRIPAFRIHRLFSLADYFFVWCFACPGSCPPLFPLTSFILPLFHGLRYHVYHPILDCTGHDSVGFRL